jgi:hypothetical protein
VAPEVVTSIGVKSSAQIAGATIINAASSRTSKAAGKLITVGTTSSEAAAVSECASGKRDVSENKRNCKNNYNLRKHEDLR